MFQAGELGKPRSVFLLRGVLRLCNQLNNLLLNAVQSGVVANAIIALQLPEGS